MSSRRESLFKTASWMGLMVREVKLTTSARGWMSWKASPLFTVMGLHLARKRTKPATAIKFKTSRTFTLRREAIKDYPKVGDATRAAGLARRETSGRVTCSLAGFRRCRKLEVRTHPPSECPWQDSLRLSALHNWLVTGRRGEPPGATGEAGARPPRSDLLGEKQASPIVGKKPGVAACRGQCEGGQIHRGRWKDHLTVPLPHPCRAPGNENSPDRETPVAGGRVQRLPNFSITTQSGEEGARSASSHPGRGCSCDSAPAPAPRTPGGFRGVKRQPRRGRARGWARGDVPTATELGDEAEKQRSRSPGSGGGEPGVAASRLVLWSPFRDAPN